MSYLMSTYQPLPVQFSRGKGPWLWDTEGNQVLDAISGLGATILGHQHPIVTQAIEKQAHQLLHLSNSVQIPEQAALAKKLCQLTQMENAFFCNSGAEAIETALKIARKYAHQRGINTPQIIVLENGFHGRTLATLSASSSRKIQAGFEPLVQGFIRAPMNDIAAIKKIANTSNQVAAILVEPILGNGGVQMLDSAYLKALRTLCNEQKCLLMFDEIQTGVGRTGAFLAAHHHGVRPDVVAMAKGLGNGLPIGACLAQGDAAHVLEPGNHGSTFGGNPFVCSISLEILKHIESEGLVDKAKTLGHYLFSTLREALSNTSQVTDIRGQGLMVGIELKQPCTALSKKALQEKLLLNITQDKVIRLLPSFVYSEKEIDILTETLAKLIREH